MELKLYNDLADWWPLMSAPEDYVEEAAAYSGFLKEASSGSLRTVLELGSGGGNNASHMKQQFALTLVEVIFGAGIQAQIKEQLCIERVRGKDERQRVALQARFGDLG